MNHITRVAAERLSLLFRSSQKSDPLPHFVTASRLLSSFQYYSTRSTKPRQPKSRESSAVASTEWPRPSEIPWQTKVANSVNLIGSVKIPVQFMTSPDGKSWASTVIAQHDSGSSNSSAFWIPVIFEGDLAHIAACHVKEKDLVYIAGQLSMECPPFANSQNEAIVQVLVQNINFVHASAEWKKSSTPMKQEECEIHFSDSVTKADDPALSTWRDLVKNPKHWWDYREKKLKKLVKANHPDFKHKDGRLSLWLDSAPTWVLPGLEGLEFEAKKPTNSKKEDTWRSLVENPEKWWDNRSRKASEKSPDFKHKETGEGLWVDSLPDWVLSQLPVLKAGRNDAAGKRNDFPSGAI